MTPDWLQKILDQHALTLPRSVNNNLPPGSYDENFYGPNIEAEQNWWHNPNPGPLQDFSDPGVHPAFRDPYFSPQQSKSTALVPVSQRSLPPPPGVGSSVMNALVQRVGARGGPLGLGLTMAMQPTPTAPRSMDEAPSWSWPQGAYSP
jgi:hypothetical protein